MTNHPSLSLRSLCPASLLFFAALLLPSALPAERFTFVSVPDFLNVDVGDISGLPTYDGGDNSTSPDFENAIDFVLDAIERENPDFVLVAGDLTMGRWDKDTDNRQIFGPTGTRAEKAAAVRAAADFYYPIWKALFADRGLMVYPALGDHDIGDNPPGGWVAGSDFARVVPVYREKFAEYFTLDAGGNPLYAERPVGTDFEDTAYAFQHGNVLFVSVDIFYQQDPDVHLDSKLGSISPEVRDGQLAWLESVLAAARADPSIDHIFVQGHAPALTPIREQGRHIVLRDGENSAFWQTLEAYEVDAYLCGEAHEMTASNHGGVEQIVHGMLLGYDFSAATGYSTTDVNYMVVEVDGDVIHLEFKRLDTTVSGEKMWQTGSNRPQRNITLDPAGYQTVGTLTIDKSSGQTVYTNRTGLFEWYGTMPEPEPQNGLQVHLDLDGDLVNRGRTGASHDGLLQNGAAFTASGGGKLGQGVALDGIDDHVIVGTPPGGTTPATVLGAAPRTASVWVQTTAADTDTALSFGSPVAGAKWDLDSAGENAGAFELGVGGGRTVGSGAATNDGQWHLLTAVFPEGGSDVADALMYVDGQFQYSGSANQTRAIDTAAERFFLGVSVNYPDLAITQFFDGTIDDAAVWDLALPAAQVRALFGLADTAGVDAGGFDALRTSHEGDQAAVQLDGVTWTHTAGGLGGADGEVLLLPDGTVSVNFGGGAGFRSGVVDRDGDGLNDYEESVAGTDPERADTDDDGFDDAFEVGRGWNAVDGDDSGVTDYVVARLLASPDEQQARGLYPEDAIRNLVVDSVLIAVDRDTGVVDLDLDLEWSEDLAADGWQSFDLSSADWSRTDTGWRHHGAGGRVFYRVFVRGGR